MEGEVFPEEMAKIAIISARKSLEKSRFKERVFGLKILV
jgi:hypothetical protein